MGLKYPGMEPVGEELPNLFLVLVLSSLSPEEAGAEPVGKRTA